MILPPRTFHLITELALRWAVPSAHIVGWAIEGLLTIFVALPPVDTKAGRMLSGLIEVSGADVLPMFRREGTVVSSIRIRRVRETPNGEWEWVSGEGITIHPADVLITRAEVERFERACQERAEDDPKGSTQTSETLPEPISPGPGAPPRYDWDAFYGAIARRVHDYGVPTSLSELVREMQEWFEERGNGSAPDESTIRRKARIVWRELRGA